MLTSYLARLTADFREFFKNPGLVGVTTVITGLVLLFIVIPIGSVLIKSFSVKAPAVTIVCVLQEGYTAEKERESVTAGLINALEDVPGIRAVTPLTDTGTLGVHVEFDKNWDDLKGLNNSRSALKAVGNLTPTVKRIRYQLGSVSRVSAGTYAEFFAKPYYYKALFNSILLATVSTGLVVTIAFCFAFLGLKGPGFLRGPLRLAGLLPLVAPPFIFALALVILGGRGGIVTRFLGLESGLYGWPGVIIAQVITFLPLGYLMIENVLRSMGSNLEDAASNLGAGRVDILFKITIPLAAPGILKAGLLVFIMAIADFGNPMLIGGDVSFLATDAYLLWTGENNLEMAAVFCVFLVVPSLTIFIVHEYLLKGKSFTTIGGKPQQSEERPVSPKILYPMLAIAAPVMITIVICFGIIFFGAFARILMIDNSFTLDHFSSPNGIRALVTSLQFAFMAALIAPIVGVTLSYILVRKRIPFKRAIESMSLLGFAVPGTVMGIGYIIFFNAPPLLLTGTFTIMVLNEAFRNLSVSLEAGVSKLHQIDVAIEEAAVDMGANGIQTFAKVVLPLLGSALAAGFVYTFMVGMITVSAVIFLITPGNNLAALYILSVAEQGSIGLACALATMLIIVVMACLGALKLIATYTDTRVF